MSHHAPGPADTPMADTDEDAFEGPVTTHRSLGHRVYAAIRETVIVVALALVLSLVVKTWLVQAFYIPSGSMEDTLVRGDRVTHDKYGLGRVEEVSGVGESAMSLIDFGSAGRVKLMHNHAPVAKL